MVTGDESHDVTAFPSANRLFATSRGSYIPDIYPGELTASALIKLTSTPRVKIRAREGIDQGGICTQAHPLTGSCWSAGTRFCTRYRRLSTSPGPSASRHNSGPSFSIEGVNGLQTHIYTECSTCCISPQHPRWQQHLKDDRHETLHAYVERETAQARLRSLRLHRFPWPSTPT